MRVGRSLVLLGWLAAAPVMAGTDHVELIASTPCLYEYRLWAFDFRRPAVFPRPSEYTREQCAQAAQVHERIQAEVAAEVAAAAAANAERANQAADQRQREAQEAVRTYDERKAERQRQEEAARAQLAAEAQALALREQQEAAARERRAKAAAARAQAQARRRPPRIGMSADEVRNGSSWGAPERVYRSITATGSQEQWVYGSSALFFRDDVLYSIHTLSERR